MKRLYIIFTQTVFCRQMASSPHRVSAQKSYELCFFLSLLFHYCMKAEGSHQKIVSRVHYNVYIGNFFVVTQKGELCRRLYHFYYNLMYQCGIVSLCFVFFSFQALCHLMISVKCFREDLCLGRKVKKL